MTHLECNPQMLRNTSNQGGLRFHGWKVQMGLSQGDLPALQESIQATAGTNSRRVLSGLRLQPQIRYPAAQRSSAAEIQDPSLQRPSPHLWCEGHFVFDGDLGSCGLSMLGAAQSSFTVVAPVGRQALGDLGSSSKATPLDQPRYHRPATQGQKAPTEKATLRAHQTGHVAQTPHSHQNRLLGMSKPQAIPKPIWSRTRATRLPESLFTRSMSPTYIPLGWKVVR